MTLASYEEQAVIGGVLLLDPGEPWPPSVQALEPEHFFDEGHRRIWEAMLGVAEGGRHPDAVSVAASLTPDDRLRALELAEECPSRCNLDQWAGQVLNAGRKRVLLENLTEISERTGAEDIGALVASIDAAVRAAEVPSQGGLRPIREVLVEAMADLEARTTDPEAGRAVATGLADYDAMVELAEGSLNIIAARPSMGKTALAGTIAVHAAKDVTRGATAIFSLEQSAVSLITRMLRSAAGVPRRTRQIESDWPKLAAAVGRLDGLDLLIDDRAGLTVADMSAALRRLPKVRLVIVDYLQIMAAVGRHERNDLAVGSITRGLKALAKEFRCVVICLSQLNREVEKRSPPIPQLSDLRHSGDIEQDADSVTFIYRPGYYKPSDPDLAGYADLIVAKQRNGPTGMVRVGWVAETTTFEDLRR